MVWWLEKGGERRQCEIRSSPEQSDCYELTWTEQDEVHVVRSTNVDELAARWLELEQSWKRAGWVKLDQRVPSRMPR